MDSSRRYTAARFSKAEPRYYKKGLIAVSCAVGGRHHRILHLAGFRRGHSAKVQCFHGFDVHV
jgi:hypothetical protein